MSRKPKTWLHTALRAQQARTREGIRLVHEARTQAEAAQAQARASAQAIDDLSAEWRRSRSQHRVVGELDLLYQRFHGHLHLLASEHAQQHRAQQQALLQGEHQLQHHHALQKALEATLERRTAAVAKGRLEFERQSTAESWLLDQCNKENSR
jgi:hypothetical protein